MLSVSYIIGKVVTFDFILLNSESACNSLYLQISDSRVTVLFLNANLKVTCFFLFLLSSSNFLCFNVIIVIIRYCTLFYIAVISVLSCNVMLCIFLLLIRGHC